MCDKRLIVMDSSADKTRYNLVYIINSLRTGGAEVGMSRLLNGMDSSRYNVTVFALDGHDSSLVDRIPSWVDIVDMKISEGIDYQDVKRIKIATQNADVIVGSLYQSGLLARLFGLISHNPTVAVWQHNEQFRSQLRKVIFKALCRYTDVVLADSKPVARMIKSEQLCKKATIRTVPIAGINLEEFSIVSHQESDNVTVSTVGNAIEQKNYETAIDVAERLSDEGISFRIAGGGPLLSDLRREARKRDVTNIDFIGKVSDVPAFLSDTDIYFQPSVYEGLCITVLEAMAAGLPVVGSNVGGIRETVKHKKTGFLHSPTDIEGFSSSIRKLSARPKLREEFGKRGREIVENNYTQDRLVSEFEKAVFG